MKPLQTILWAVALLLCLLHIVILVGHGRILVFYGLTPAPGVLAYGLVVLACAVALIWGILKTGVRRRKGFRVFCGASTVLLAAGVIWLLLDAPPPENDYMENDIRIESNGSYTDLAIFNNPDIEALREKSRWFADKEANTVPVREAQRIWEEISDYREAIARLDAKTVICDLPPRSAIDMETPFMQYGTLKEVAAIYHAYCMAMLSQGKGPEAVKPLAQFYRVARKGMRDATLLFNKTVFMTLAGYTMESAYAAVQSEACDASVLRQLKADFTALDRSEYNLRKVLIGEYLILKSSLRKSISPETFLETCVLGPDGARRQEPNNRQASAFAYYFGFKPNRSLRDIKDQFDLLIEGQEDEPPDFSAAQNYVRQYAQKPPVRNIVGWILNNIAYPDFESHGNRVTAIKVKSDLLAIAIRQRLNEPAEAQDVFSGEAYRYKEEDGHMRHPGRDGAYDTGDDIVLSAF